MTFDSIWRPIWKKGIATRRSWIVASIKSSIDKSACRMVKNSCGTAYLSIDDLKLPWTRLWLISGADQHDEWGAEQHFDNASSTITYSPKERASVRSVHVEPIDDSYSSCIPSQMDHNSWHYTLSASQQIYTWNIEIFEVQSPAKTHVSTYEKSWLKFANNILEFVFSAMGSTTEWTLRANLMWLCSDGRHAKYGWPQY